VTDPVQAVIEVAEDATTYTLRGTSIPKATITVSAPGRNQPYRATADAQGRWSIDVELRRGRNQFDIDALDPETGKTAETTARVFITVPFLVIEAPTLTVDSPAEGAQFENGAIPVKGSTTNAKKVSVSAYMTGAADGAPATTPNPAASPGKPDVGPVTVDAAADGSFETPLDLAAGKWQIVITATSGRGRRSRSPGTCRFAKGVNLVVSVKVHESMAQGLGRRQAVPGHGCGGQGLRPGQGADVHGQELDRGPHGQVERDVLHAQQREPRAHVRQSNPRPGCSRHPTIRFAPIASDVADRSSSSPSGSRRSASRVA
jgi:nitrogen fixation protein FixH